MSNRIEKASIEISDYAQSISKGGTSGMSVEQASVNLGYVRNTTLGANGGIAKTNSLGKLPSSVLSEYEVTGNVNTIGPVTTALGGLVNKYVITNYSSFTPYTVTTTNGTVSVAGDVISYTPLNVAGLGGFTVNGELFTVTVSETEVVDPEQPIPVVVAKPVIVSPVTGVTNISNKVSCTSSAFTMTSGTDTHAASHWQISTSSTFATILYESIDDAVNKTSWTSGVLAVSTKYYIRVRYKGELSGYGSWSTVVNATTKSSFLPSSEVQKFYEPGTTSSSNDGNFGQIICISRDGSTAIIGRNNRIWVFIKTASGWIDQTRLIPVPDVGSSIGGVGGSAAISDDGNTIAVGCDSYSYISMWKMGCVVVFKRIDGVWVQDAILVSNDGEYVSTNTGRSVSISGDGNAVLAGAPGRSNNSGGAFLFKKSGGIWSQTHLLVGNDSVADDRFGTVVYLSNDGTKAIISPRPVTAAIGVVYAFDITESTAVQKKKFGAYSGGKVGDRFGSSIDMSIDNSILIIGATGADASTTLLNSGTVETYIPSSNGTWAYVSKMIGLSSTAGGGFGYSISISEDKSSVLVGAPGQDGGRGAAYIFTRSTYTWTQKTKLIASDRIAYDNFGSASALSGDGLSCLVSAPNALFRADLHDEVGAVYVFN